MNILMKFRNPYASLLLAMTILFYSCLNSNESYEKSFSYDTFKSFKKNYQNFDFAKYSLRTDASTLEKSQEILDQINYELGTNLAYPDFALEAIDYEANAIIEISLEREWISQDFASLTQIFMNDIQLFHFDEAIQKLESNTLDLSLSPDEFDRVNLFANTLKSINLTYPDLFDHSTKDNGWRCVLALIALASATAGLGSCVTIAACALAVTLHVNALYAVADHCGSKEKPALSDS